MCCESGSTNCLVGTRSDCSGGFGNRWAEFFYFVRSFDRLRPAIEPSYRRRDALPNPRCGFPVWLASQDADKFLTQGTNETNFAQFAECGVHFSPRTPHPASGHLLPIGCGEGKRRGPKECPRQPDRPEVQESRSRALPSRQTSNHRPRPAILEGWREVIKPRNTRTTRTEVWFSRGWRGSRFLHRCLGMRMERTHVRCYVVSQPPPADARNRLRLRVVVRGRIRAR